MSVVGRRRRLVSEIACQLRLYLRISPNGFRRPTSLHNGHEELLQWHLGTGPQLCLGGLSHVAGNVGFAEAVVGGFSAFRAGGVCAFYIFLLYLD